MLRDSIPMNDVVIVNPIDALGVISPVSEEKKRGEVRLVSLKQRNIVLSEEDKTMLIKSFKFEVDDV